MHGRFRDIMSGAASRFFFLLALLSFFYCFGCSPEPGRDLLRLVDVVPRDVSVGDKLEILGVNLPLSAGQEISVSLVGTLMRPGQAPITGQSVEAFGATMTPDKVIVPVSDALISQLCGSGPSQIHTTFEGRLQVLVRTPKSSDAVTGQIRDVTIDFRPPTPRRSVVEAREHQAMHLMVDVLGLDVVPPSESGGYGLIVSQVAPNRPAQNAQIIPGDRLVSIDGVTITAISDLIPSGQGPVVQLGVQRASEPVALKQLPLLGYQTPVSSDLLGAGILLGVAAALILLFMAPTSSVITWIERRIAGRMQARLSQGHGESGGILTWFSEGMRSVLREDLPSPGADPLLLKMAPSLICIGVSATFLVMPLSQYLGSSDIDIGILFLIAVTALAVVGIMTGGWSSNNKWSLMGGLRSAAQIVSCELPGAIAITCLVLMTGSLRMQDLILAQSGPVDVQGSIFSVGGWPWFWFSFRSPITFALFLLYFSTALAESNRASLDLPEAESSLSSGREPSGLRYLFFFFAEWANVFVMCGIASAIFLGGWQLPGISPAQQEAHLPLQLAGALLFIGKSWLLVFTVVGVRWALPRVRIDQMMHLCWKWLVPISSVGLLLTLLWIHARVDENQLVKPIVSSATFVTCLALCIHFVSRIRNNLREARVQVHLNPFL